MEIRTSHRPVSRALDAVETGAYLLPPVLMVNALGVPYLISLNLIVGALIYCFSDVRRNPWTYLFLAGAWAPELVSRWYRHEDHVYLAVYWCLAIGLARLSATPVATLQYNARLLIGLCFAFAVLGKLRAPEFLDGTLFHYLLLEDVRFTRILSAPLGGLTPTMIHENDAALSTLNGWNALGHIATLHSPPRIGLLAGVMTGWTLLMEATLATMFLAPMSERLEQLRHTLLITFCVGVYVVAPVVGFGCLFFAMGASLCGDAHPSMRRTYIALYIGLLSWLLVRAFVLSG